MTVLKQFLAYFFWILISILSGIGYMRIVLGPKPKPSEGFMKLIDWTYEVALIQVGTIIGAFIALIFILLNTLYLNKKLEENSTKNIIRFITILIITFVVGSTHYFLEKVIDII